MAFCSNSFLYRIQHVAILCAICLLFTHPSHGQPPYPRWICPDSGGNYTTNSTYESNLGLLLKFLPSNGTATGYADATIGDIPDRIYGLVLCRGDVQGRDCGNCLDTAAVDILQFCPNSRSAITWYETCLLRYANQRFLGTPDSRQLRDFMYNVNNVSADSAPEFNASRWEVLGGLARYAVGNISARPPMFGAGETDLRLVGDDDRYKKFYGLVQCSQDISRDDCDKCLQDLFDFLTICCPRRVGAVVLAASCNIRYETYTYYNWSSKILFPPLAAAASPGSAPTSSAPLPGGNNKTENVDTGNKNKVKVVATVIISLGVVLLLIVILGYIYKNKRLSCRRISQLSDVADVQIGDFQSLRFDLSTIMSATNNFASSNILGKGGFGEVYKGLLPNGNEIAVKRLLKTSKQGLKELRNEVILLAKLQHRNLVRIVGVCLEGEEKLLVYEYIPNKSLDTFLFDPSKKQLLTWDKRYKIIQGIARGLLYLHEESQLRIIHRDLKASNILLDADMNPKIADFGLARLFEGNETHASTENIAGTLGYMSPEYIFTGQFSIKSDVFSFGVLVLEIVTGRQRTKRFGDDTTDLLSYVWTHWSSGEAFEIIDQTVARSASQSEVYRCIQIGLLCVQELPTNRPTMASVLLLMDSHSATIQNPGRPAMFAGFSTAAAMNYNSGSTYGPSGTSLDEPIKSYPEIGSTGMGPR